MPHATLLKFGYPATVVKAYEHWVVMVRPAQVTVGSVVLASLHEAQALAALPPEAFAELGVVIPALESALKKAIGCEKLNYLALMMVDKEVHFHVIPRYEGERTLADITLPDAGWPALPAMGSGVALTEPQQQALKAALQAHW